MFGRPTLRKRMVRLLIAALAASAAITETCAQAYPGKPIRMIVAVPPGGPADTLARLVGPRLGEALGQTVVIDNRPGANGNIAYEMAARAVPDGYTLVLVAAGIAINPSLYHEVKYAGAYPQRAADEGAAARAGRRSGRQYRAGIRGVYPERA